MQAILMQQSLASADFSRSAAAAYRALIAEAHHALDDGGVPRDGRRVWIAPGRIEVLGKHVDYAGGRSLLCTVERGIVLVARPRADGQVVIRDARRGEALTMPLINPSRGSIPWGIYPRTVIHRLVRNFGSAVQGMDIGMASNLPPAAGVSSSSALTVGLTLAFVAVSDLTSHPAWNDAIVDRQSFAGYVGALENGTDFGPLAGERGVGTMGGAQDQTAILCSTMGQLGVFSWAPVQFERRVAWPSTHAFVVGVSGVVAAKTGAAKERYNRAARTAQRLVDAWNGQAQATAHATTQAPAPTMAPTPVRTLRDAFIAAAGGGVPDDVPAALVEAAVRAADGEFSATHLTSRLEQFFEETFVLVPGATDALARNDLAEFGRLVDRSQAGAERALENQIAETIHLQRLARELGADAASAFGAGFGGSVWAMVTAADGEKFAARWREQYLRAHPHAAHRSMFFVTAPSGAAAEVRDG